MRLTLVVALFLAALSPLSAQQIDGTFTANNDSIIFSDDHVRFRLTGFAGLHNVQVGEGTFEIVDNFLIIRATDYSGAKTTVEAVPGTSEEAIIVSVVCEQGFAVQGIFIESIGSGRRGTGRINALSTNSFGRVYLPKNEYIRQINVSGMGFDNIAFDHTPGNDHRVTIARNMVLENITIAFRFNQIDEETISILLLSTDFEEGRNRDRALERLNRRAERNNRIERRMRKVFVPFEFDLERWRQD